MFSVAFQLSVVHFSFLFISIAPVCGHDHADEFCKLASFVCLASLSVHIQCTFYMSPYGLNGVCVHTCLCQQCSGVIYC